MHPEIIIVLLFLIGWAMATRGIDTNEKEYRAERLKKCHENIERIEKENRWLDAHNAQYLKEFEK